MDGRGHINVNPHSRVIEAKMGGDKKAGARGLGVLAILQAEGKSQLDMVTYSLGCGYSFMGTFNVCGEWRLVVGGMLCMEHATSKTWRHFIKKASCGAAQQENIFIEIDEHARGQIEDKTLWVY